MTEEEKWKEDFEKCYIHSSTCKQVAKIYYLQACKVMQEEIEKLEEFKKEELKIVKELEEYWHDKWKQHE